MPKNKFCDFIKRHHVWAVALFLGILPILSVILACAADGRAFWDVSILNSAWNDELYYYKIVEGILHGGFPYGFFGFNESHASILSFAAWSPLLYLPWVLFGAIFGWNLYSPIAANLFYLSLAMVAYGLLAKPSKKQVGLLTFLFFLFRPIARYILSAMPEIVCMSLLLVFYGFYCHAVNTKEGDATEKAKRRDLVMMFILAALLTMMRPYLGLFFILPCILWIRHKRLQGIVGSLLILTTVISIYAWMQKTMTAQYLTPLYNTQWVRVFLGEGIFQGIYHVLFTIYNQGKMFLAFCIEAFRSGIYTGAYYCVFLATALILAVYTISCRLAKRREEFYFHLYLTSCYFVMLLAIFLMYQKMQESSKHLLTFTFLGIFVISNMKTRFYKKAVFIGMAFAFFFLTRTKVNEEYHIPYIDTAAQEKYLVWKNDFANHMALSTEQIPSFDNVVIWGFDADTVGGSKLFDWHILYALPKGFGISCCTKEYLTAQEQNLQSRY
ncbi:MAG: hypothetical protein LBM60_06965, partial [Clostridium sp.]|nr:hypothetical protein [Clostridium sp.]